ncbi:MAG TPA: hypothetical protein VFK13_09700 [Gemmatimonadaceae bacterium]|nr:hypothetical protein [Gemmatimonadaceae bacterium]
MAGEGGSVDESSVAPLTCGTSLQWLLRKMQNSVYIVLMEHRISATELARSLGDILGRIRYKGESFTVMRNGHPVARLTPVHSAHAATVREAFEAWTSAIGRDPTLADDLERIGASDRPPRNPWGS